ncbi:cell division protein FtsB [Thalassotalea litorea]|uniref:cell division protein FtsB n=1 Tax=Thalassotalea litorea TaxID=2020715 RepID=UPI0037362B0D
MKIINAILIILVLLLQYRLWFGKNSIGDYLTLEQRVIHQSEQNQKLQQRNKLVYADIDDLKNGLEAIEENARNELGMIKDGEVFFRVIPKEN